MTPPPGDGNPFSSSQDAGANPIDAALDKAARIAETLLQNIGYPDPKTAPAPAAEAPPAGAVSVDEAMPAAEDPVEAIDPPRPEAAEDPAAPAPPVEPVEPPSPVDPSTEVVSALVREAPIEDQLERIEGLLDEAQAQIGDEAPAKDRRTPPAAPPACPAPDANGQQSEMFDFDGLPAEADLPRDDREAQDDAADGEASPARPRGPDPDTAWSQLVILLQDVLCGLLNRVDRPFVRVAYPTRQILGVCALVTLLLSIVTFLLAHL